MPVHFYLALCFGEIDCIADNAFSSSKAASATLFSGSESKSRRVEMYPLHTLCLPGLSTDQLLL